MENMINSYIKEQFGIADVDIRTYSPLTLAYIGDGIFDIVIRSVVVAKGNSRANDLHKRTSKIVKAHTQALMIEALEGELTEEEADIYRRGRNAKSGTMAKNASMSDYRKATGFEALMGYLYLKDDFERIVFLTKRAMELLEIVI
ncbi:MAG: ribonuclease III domain-containing protein [Agathobacter sp.]|nr:ribonuclease III domain-containing protein [Agathobacter sp.]